MGSQVETRINVQFENRNRTTVFFRLILVLPIAIISYLLSNNSLNFGESDLEKYFDVDSQTFSESNFAQFADLVTSTLFTSASTLVIVTVLTLLFRQTYISYLYAFNRSVLELSTRIWAYLYLMNDDYPSLEKNENVAIEFPDVEGGKKLNQFLPLVKWFLAIPLYVVLLIYSIAAFFVTVYAWFAILFTGKYPKIAAELSFGVIAFSNRISGYAFILVTDTYPSFSLPRMEEPSTI